MPFFCSPVRLLNDDDLGNKKKTTIYRRSKINQKRENWARGKSHSAVRKSTAAEKETVSSKRTLDDDNDVDTSDDSVAGYVHPHSLLRRNAAESGDESMSNGSEPVNPESFEAMEY